MLTAQGGTHVAGDASMLERVQMTRRQLLRGIGLMGVGLAGVVGVGCGVGSTPATPTQAASAQTGAAPGAAPKTSSWDALLGAGRAEGKVVVSGPPDPGASTKIPEGFK